MSTSCTTPLAERKRAGKQQRALLVDFVKRCLTREERLLITLHYCEALTLNEVAAVLKRPFEYISRLHESILARVRRQLSPASDDRVLVA
jgi:DNA-directed RNA polymerase specialized sigma subunit